MATKFNFECVIQYYTDQCPGPTTTLPRTSATAQSSLGSDNVTNILCMQCLYFNARSLTNKICELQTLVTDVDLLAVTCEKEKTSCDCFLQTT